MLSATFRLVEGKSIYRIRIVWILSYLISIFFVRCKCNGHAERCVEFEDNNFETRLKCACEHNTDGVDCEKCAPFYNDQPWSAATYEHPFKCEREC